MSRISNALPQRLIERALCAISDIAWRVPLGTARKGQRASSWVPGKRSDRPSRSAIPLGVPRTTRSVCPHCVIETRNAVLDGRTDINVLKRDPGVINAEIIEEAGRVLMRKICQIHGPFEDVLATDAAFFRRMERLYPGPDFACTEDDLVHDHGVSSVRYGRGAFLVFDLTNRCNMKCWPCFMDANAVGHVHELDLDDIKRILERARSFKPQREVNILFSGGEPTISPFFLDAIGSARALGFKRLHVATNGIRFAQDADFAQQAREAGLHSVFLQLDGVSDESNSHRGVSNLFRVKQQAMENLANAGLRITLQVTVAIRNVDKVFSVVFQPIMFTGRDENVTDDRRYAQRYTLSQLAADLGSQMSTEWEPLRDWFPTAAISQFSDVLDLLQPSDSAEGSVAPNEHPDWGVMSPLIVNRRTGFWVPIARFFNLERFNRDLQIIANSGRGKALTYARLAMAILRNYSPDLAPSGFSVVDFVDLFRQCSARTRIASPTWERDERGTGEWVTTIVYGQWFQDLVVQNLAAIETSMTPVATQEGEIPFSAYNSVGWRQLVEQLHRTATLPQWHRQHGRHAIHAKGNLVQVLGAGKDTMDCRDGALAEKPATLSCCESESPPQ
ncbi:MAG: radical SAM protein [Acidobacteria bacterium]|nr:MAG: radical SAM protein [Acidobacteriota bacterium]